MGLRLSALGVACALLASGAALAEQAAQVDRSMSPVATHPGAAPPSSGDAKSDFLVDIEVRKSHPIMAGEIVGFDLVLNEFSLNEVDLSELDSKELKQHFAGDEYKSNVSSISPSRRSSWRADYDPFTTIQLGHAYQWTVVEGFRPTVESSRLTKDSETRR